MPTRLILIRHGETDWSYKRRYCSFSDISLNKRGRAQARQVSNRLRGEEIHKIYSSDMKRTLQFARIIFKGRHIKKSPGLREINFGVFEGLEYQKIMDKYPEIYTRWIDSPAEITISKGENLKDMAERTRKVLAKILSHDKGKTVAIFAHAGPIKVILCDSLKLGLNQIWKMKAELASINIVVWNSKFHTTGGV